MRKKKRRVQPKKNPGFLDQLNGVFNEAIQSIGAGMVYSLRQSLQTGQPMNLGQTLHEQIQTISNQVQKSAQPPPPAEPEMKEAEVISVKTVKE